MSKNQKMVNDNGEPYLLRGNRKLVSEISSKKLKRGCTSDTYINMAEPDHVTTKAFADFPKTIIDKLDGICDNTLSIRKDITIIH